MCVSAVTRSPGLTSVTSLPTDSTTPVNSCPGTRGGRMRDAAHASHSMMWRSVPQIANAVTRTRTSLGPTDGIGTVVGWRPGPGDAFWIAHIVPFVTIGSFEVVTGTAAPFADGDMR